MNSKIELPRKAVTWWGKKWFKKREGMICVGTVNIHLMADKLMDGTPYLHVQTYHNGQLTIEKTMMPGDMLTMGHSMTIHIEQRAKQ